ncbi:ABC transporter ATP-binding protein [Palleronia abyssalis]|mgnify:CR=1 FL=1|uniref:High-affinity branched-chain amino acid transport ATP-binding protein LivF n=1 Tax=Palleronia abyssalis TaxID=1501240 RepID=A0A2R8BVG6_9RHOB|nr:ABC transporter ATP-binding protein [Palleronia abyssalis]SPJ24120.1 High-affinity branched-chain amino acid transport ATP-binding protein LivF [Palleronia abyssalis]
MSTDAILEIENIELVYNRSVQVLKGLSLTVPRGQVVTLLGSNGAGKSSTLKAVSRLLFLENGDLTAGRIRFDGMDTKGQSPHALVRRGLFHVMEGRRVFEDLTVEENLTAATFATTGRAEKRPNGFDAVYEYFPRLHERRKALAGYLSGGEQQMLAIGRALVADPKLILLDEPSLGLSPQLVEEIFTIIGKISRQTGVSMLLVEQNAAVAFAVAQYGYIMESGRIQLDGPTDRLLADQDVREFYLGTGGDRERSYRDIKHYKRRKRWLS